MRGFSYSPVFRYAPHELQYRQTKPIVRDYHQCDTVRGESFGFAHESLVEPHSHFDRLSANGFVIILLAVSSSSGFNPAPNGTGQASNLAADMAGAKELINTTCTPGQSPQQTLRLTSADVEDLAAFLKTLTDERVRWEKAPFDHPSLAIPNGHTGDENKVTFNKATNQAKQDMIVLPAVGAAGRQAKGLPALQTFDSGLK